MSATGSTAPGESWDPPGATMPYVPLDGRPWRLAMGLRPLSPARWLEFGAGADEQLALKAELLARRRDEVLSILEGSAPACEELLGELLANLAQHHPDRPRAVDPAEPALVAASRLVPEDLCVLEETDGRWRLSAASVCFPSRWDLGEKMGRGLDEIHAPVPGYAEALATATNRFFDRLEPSRGYWRLNWTLLDDAALFQPSSGPRPRVEDPARWQFRVERQTLRRLAHTGAVIFTIRTYVRSAHDLAAEHGTFAADVLTVLASAPPGTVDYKGWNGLADRWRRRYPEAESVSVRTRRDAPSSRG